MTSWYDIFKCRCCKEKKKHIECCENDISICLDCCEDNCQDSIDYKAGKSLLPKGDNHE